VLGWVLGVLLAAVQDQDASGSDGDSLNLNSSGSMSASTLRRGDVVYGAAATFINRPQVLLLFASAGLLPALAELLHQVLTDTDGETPVLLETADRIGDLFLAVATTASARSHLAARSVLKGAARDRWRRISRGVPAVPDFVCRCKFASVVGSVLVRDLRYLHPKLLVKLLKVLRQVSALSAGALDTLQSVGAIPTLVNLLDRPDGPFVQVRQRACGPSRSRSPLLTATVLGTRLLVVYVGAGGAQHGAVHPIQPLPRV